MAIEDERVMIPIGEKVIVRKNGAEGRVTRLATNGKWPEMVVHEVVYGLFNRRGWFEAYDLLVLNPIKES
jgi:hypothetical protein